MTFSGSNDLDLTFYTDYPEFEFEYASKREPETLPPEMQHLVVGIDRHRVNGAPVTCISGFVGRRLDLIKIENELQGVCHTCGSSKMYDIILVKSVKEKGLGFAIMNRLKRASSKRTINTSV